LAITAEKHEELVESNNTKEKPRGVTLPDGTFIPNQPTKETTVKKNELETQKSCVDNPKGSAVFKTTDTGHVQSTYKPRRSASKLQRVGGGVVEYTLSNESKTQNREVNYWITSSGKRHNSSCRYYENTQNGHYTTSRDEGYPCKKCGG